MMLALSDKWAPFLVSQPETGMGYWIVSVILLDGRKFDKVCIVGGYITTVNGSTDLPFQEPEIEQIIVNHGK